MKELTYAQRISAMTAAAAAFNKILSFAHANGWNERFNFDMSYLYHDYEDKLWFTMWGVIDGDDSAMNLRCPDLYAHYNDIPFFSNLAMYEENINAAADECLKKMQDFIDHYDEYAEKYRAKKAAEAAVKEDK